MYQGISYISKHKIASLSIWVAINRLNSSTKIERYTLYSTAEMNFSKIALNTILITFNYHSTASYVFTTIFNIVVVVFEIDHIFLCIFFSAKNRNEWTLNTFLIYVLVDCFQFLTNSWKHLIRISASFKNKSTTTANLSSYYAKLLFLASICTWFSLTSSIFSVIQILQVICYY